MFLALRLVIVLQALMMLIQAVFAGFDLSGHESMLSAHRAGAWVVLGLAVAQVVLAVLYVRSRRRPIRPAITSAAVLVVVIIQISVGFGHGMALHIPLGVALFGGTVQLLGWAAVEREQPVADAQQLPARNASRA